MFFTCQINIFFPSLKDPAGLLGNNNAEEADSAVMSDIRAVSDTIAQSFVMSETGDSDVWS